MNYFKHNWWKWLVAILPVGTILFVIVHGVLQVPPDNRPAVWFWVVLSLLAVTAIWAILGYNGALDSLTHKDGE